jgi:hypothetical protein
MDKQDTIQQDVSQQVEKQIVASPQMQQREKTFSALVERAEEEMDRQAAGNQTTEQTVAQVIDDPSQYRVRVKIDGQEKELAVADVVTSYQKNEVASERLRQASERNKKLDDREQYLNDWERQLQQQSLSTDPAQDSGIDDDQTAITQALELVAEGDFEQASKLLNDTIKKGRSSATTPAVNIEQVTKQVEENLSGKQIWDDFLKDNPVFQIDYDNAGNPIVSKQREYGDFIYLRDFKPQVDSGAISYQEALNQTAERVRNVFETPETTQQQATTGQEQRLLRKQAIDNIPVAAGARSVGPAVQQEESRADVLAGMRKARGLA